MGCLLMSLRVTVIVISENCRQIELNLLSLTVRGGEISAWVSILKPLVKQAKKKLQPLCSDPPPWTRITLHTSLWTGMMLSLCLPFLCNYNSVCISSQEWGLLWSPNMSFLVPDVDVISRFAQLEFRFGDPEHAKALFESTLNSYPKRTDIWSIYMDIMIKQGSQKEIRWVVL